MIEELNEGEPPKGSQISNLKSQIPGDACTWKIIEISEGADPLVTFQAGAVTFSCYKSGRIYKAWEQESARGGSSMRENNPYSDAPPAQIVFVESTPYTPSDKGWQEQPALPPAAQMADSQLEEGELRLGKLRKKAWALDWCDHDKDICTGKCALLDEIRAIEKKILGDP